MIPRDGRFLVIRRSQYVVAPRAICFPGGGIRSGEDEETALRRELREELGVDVHPVRRLWRSITPWKVPLAWWLCGLGEAVEIRPDPREVESTQWLRPEELAATEDLLESNRHFLAAWQRNEFDLSLDE